MMDNNKNFFGIIGEVWQQLLKSAVVNIVI